ncbi:hypothetical protein DSO57_1022740 [Entomophthora muscae]|uniref:Uncharacterized protein n=1 Tax=Entomophthora muscae TaxID=34485 RepID=A0ACC2RU26_9FUNG|nr:hypothetical protein DSO57_1022740 [Entomophthora muscae]
MNDSLKAKAQDKVSQSVDKIAQIISSNTERMSENCQVLTGASKICQNLGKYPILKSSNVTEKDGKVRDAIDKINRGTPLNASCLTDITNLFCILEYQKCSPEGTLLPICESSRDKLLKSCFGKSEDFTFYPERLSNSTNCFPGVKPEPVEVSQKPSSDKSQEATTGNVSQPEKTITPKKVPSSSTSESQLKEIPLAECTRSSYLARWGNSTCFAFKPPKDDQLPSAEEANYKTGRLEFELAEGVKCRDTLNLLGVQVQDPCACDTRLSVLRTCSYEIVSQKLQRDSKVISFRDVEYFPGLENQLKFIAKRGYSEQPNDSNDPHYFRRSYYRTCDRLIGVPDVFKDKTCSYPSSIDPPEPSSTSIEVYSDFKGYIEKSFRFGCTIAECLNHLRYMPPHQKAKEADSFGDAGYKSDVCRQEISNCPEWNFNAESISIEGYPPNIVSYLELDVEALPNTNRAAVIFSFRALAQPVYEGMRFLVNGMPAMDLVYNQTNYRALAVPLIPGRSHILRWEFIRGDASAASGLNSVDIQTIALRDAHLARPFMTDQLLRDQQQFNNMPHIAPVAPTKPLNVQQSLSSTAGAASTSSLISVLVILLTALGVGGLAMWLCKRHKNDKISRGGAQLSRACCTRHPIRVSI